MSLVLKHEWHSNKKTGTGRETNGYGRTLLEAIRRAVHIIPKDDESACKL
jgi:hypothetical protein